MPCKQKQRLTNVFFLTTSILSLKIAVQETKADNMTGRPTQLECPFVPFYEKKTLDEIGEILLVHFQSRT